MRIVIIGVKEKNKKTLFDEFFYPLIKQGKIETSNIHSTKQVSGGTTFAITDVDKDFLKDITDILKPLIKRRIVKKSNIHIMEK